jgi:hypothetical protein
LLLDLVTVLITDVHMRNGPQVRRQDLLDQRRAIFFSSLKVCTRHAFPSPANGQYHRQPYQLLRSGSGRILAKQAEHSIARLAIAIW